MRLFFAALLCVVSSLLAHSQNVGIGTTTPTERLDVNGNVNIAGNLLVNGNTGTPGQVLMKDATNTMFWGDLSEFKNTTVFQCLLENLNGQTQVCVYTWTVPPGVTNIFVECWGGGGAGSKIIGGGGGGYSGGKFTVVPGAVATINVGAGGRNSASSSLPGGAGSNSQFFLNSIWVKANGGEAAPAGDPFAPGNVNRPKGGAFEFTTGCVGLFGSPGGDSKLSFQQWTTNGFATVMEFGNGGDAALLPGSGGQGGRVIFYTNGSGTQVFKSFGSDAIQYGGGGAADDALGRSGKAGRVIIRW